MQGSRFIIFNALTFQLVWWSSVLYGNQALALLCLLLMLHFGLSPSPMKDAGLMIRFSLIGWLVDGLLAFAGVFSFTAFPFWLLLLWLHFSITLHHSLSFCRRLPGWVQAVLGGVAGCLSYLGGARFGAVALPLGHIASAAILMIIWSVLLPLGCRLADSTAEKHRAARESRENPEETSDDTH